MGPYEPQDKTHDVGYEKVCLVFCYSCLYFKMFTLKIKVTLPANMGLFRKKKTAVQDKQAIGKPWARPTKERNVILWKRRKSGGVVLNWRAQGDCFPLAELQG